MKLHLLLFCIVLSLFLENGPVSGLKFAPGKAVKVDNPDGVIEVGKRTKLTCNYATSSRETVNSIHWYFSVNGYNEKIFTYVVSRGQRQITEDLNLDVTVFGHSATQRDLEIELNEYKPTIIVKCEIEAIKDNGYGQRTPSNKDGQKSFTVIRNTRWGTTRPPVVSTETGPYPSDHNVHDEVHMLMNFMDPRRHMHPGVAYDFYSGYLLMVAKNVDIEGSRSSYRQTEATHLYGQLPSAVIRDIQSTHRGKFQEIANKKYKIAMNPVDVLNFLGKHGFRVIGFTAEADQKMVWTLEEKDFENKIMNSGHGIDHIHH